MKKWNQDCVPIIQQDLSHEETLLQIAFALDALETVASNVFRHVHLNLEKGKCRLEKLQRRCTVVEAKVKKITGINKSLKVVSTNKYPGRENDVFVYSHEPAMVCQNDGDITCRPLSPDKMNMREKLKFFHVKDSSDILNRDYERYPEEGLGDIPENISSVCRMFLFNTTENLYKKYKITDPLSFSNTKQNVLQDIYKNKLQVEPAPKSIDSHFDWLNYRHDQDYFYSPTQNDVPDIQAPLDLPDLPGIAGDLQFLLDTPIEERKPLEKKDDEASTSQIESIPAPVPELPKATINHDIPQESASKSEPVVSNAPPPPPPPPPAPPTPPPIIDSIIENKVQQGPSASSRPPADHRAHLMDAIRKAGGVSTLKPISKKTEETKAPRKPTGNSMMDELHDKLSWRRKGISGKFDSDAGIMDRIVSMIPPPPSKPPDLDSDKEWDD